MSYETEADRALAQAREHAQEAVKALARLVIDRCEGYDDFRPERVADIREAFQKALALRDTLR